MPERMLLPQRMYGLSVADGRRAVRPGEIVGLRFRLRNRNPSASPAARVTFDLPGGWTPLDPVDAVVGPLAPGAEACVNVRARAAAGDDDGAPACVQAALHAGGAPLGSNVVVLQVAGRPALGGPRSGIRIEPTERADRLQIGVTVVNEGDAAARAVRVVVPPPPGFGAGDDAFTRSCAEIAPGAAFHFAYEATAVGPTCGIVSVDDGYAEHAGTRVRIPTLAAHALAAQIAAPLIEAERTANRLDATVRISNEGWVPARDVACRIELPAGWRLLAGTAVVDDVPAIVRRSEGRERGETIVVPFVAPRSCATLRFVATAARSRPDGLLRIRCADQVAERAIGAARGRVRLVACSETAFTEPGGALHLLVYVQNLTPATETIALAIDGQPLRNCELRAGATIAFDAPAVVPADTPDGATLHFTVAARSVAGHTLAEDRVEIRVVERTALAFDDGAPAADEERTPEVSAVWCAPAQSRAGERCELRLAIRAGREIETLRVRPYLPPGLQYVAGSTVVNGCGIVDECDGPPLLSSAGLGLYGVPAGSCIDVGWSVLAHAAGERALGAEVLADGEPIAVPAGSLDVVEPPPFGIRINGLPFHVDAATTEAVQAAIDPLDVPPPPDTRVTFTLDLDAPRRTRIARLLGGARGPGITAHLALIAALFPTAAGADDPHLTAALAAAGEAVRDVYERLFVKARIPGYEVTPYDLEDAEVRRTVRALLALAAEAPAGASPTGPGGFRITLERGELIAAARCLEQSPLGGPVAVATLTALLPRADGGASCAALGSYAAQLAAELEECRDLSLDAFGAFVMMHTAPLLERARDAAMLAIDAAPAIAAA